MGDGVRSPKVGGGSFIWLVDLLIGCFDFILNLCIFLKMLRCQLMNGGQKTPSFCHDRMAAAPVGVIPLFPSIHPFIKLIFTQVDVTCFTPFFFFFF